MANQETGYVKATATNKAGYFNFVVVTEDDAEGFWINSGGKEAIVAKGDNISFQWIDGAYGKDLVKKSLTKEAKAPKPAPAAVGGKGKGGYVDNSIGQGIGAAVNNSVQLFIAGKITEKQIPTAIRNLYTLSEYAKKLATAGELDNLVAVTSFGFTNAPKGAATAAVVEPEEKEEPVVQTRTPRNSKPAVEAPEPVTEAPKAPRGKKSTPVVPPEPEEQEDESDVDENGDSKSPF